MSVRQLFDSCLFIGQSIIPQVSISIIVIPLGSAGVAAPVAHGDDDKTELCQPVSPVHSG